MQTLFAVAQAHERRGDYAEVNGTRLWYEVAGSGDTVVLLVDDVPDNVAVLHDALDEAGYTVLVADGNTAAGPNHLNFGLESEQGQIVRALAAGAHEYLIKPFTGEALLEKLDLLGLVPVTAGDLS